MDTIRQITKVVTGVATQDGAEVELTRMIGTKLLPMLDPILLFDVFGSDKPDAYIAGFPPHPHRGFETVTYMLDGKMRHQDSAGHNGVIEAGDVQWMTAGKGIIHSEMPEQTQGRLAGFQLWLNLPADKKMSPPAYQEYKNAQFPIEELEGVSITVIAGKTQAGTEGLISNKSTQPVFWVIKADKQAQFNNVLPAGHNALFYVISGAISVEQQSISTGQLAVLSDDGDIQFNADVDAQVLLVAGAPLNEPVSRSGPFVMNTREQVEQAYQDYQQGILASP
jgi:hypothetical protein